MSEAYDLGKVGENIAVDYLLHKDYQILERNWRLGHKEIDIIAFKDNMLVIVEVKTRKSETYGEPENAVGDSKQRTLVCAANAYVRYKNLDVDVRFDIISIIVNERGQHIEHIEDAFTPGCTTFA
jgi:putative endonuclease